MKAEEPLQRFEFVQIRMGVPVRILVYAPARPSAIQATDAAYARIKQLDGVLSDYDPDSELMQLCTHHAPGEAVNVSPDLWRVLAAARELNRKTGGVFDVTVGPVVKLWRTARRRRRLPDDDRLHTALSRVGDQFIKVDADRRTVTLTKPEMQLDFGGIAKGDAADQALKVLQKHHLPRALIAVAGDIRVGDPPPGEVGWRVEVEDRSHPPGEQRSAIMLSLANQAVSTSGDTYQFLEIDGVRYSHIVDPKTGLGLTTPGSVTVIAPTGLQADGLASAVSILGPERGLKLIQQTPQTAAMIVELGEDDQARVSRSPGWEAFVAK